MSDHDGAGPTHPSVRPDGGRNDDTDEFGDDVDAGVGESRGGFWSRLFPGRDPMVRSLKQRLQEANRAREELSQRIKELQSRIDELAQETAALEETKTSYEQRQFAMNALLRSVGRSFDQASDDLADVGVTVGDLDVTLHADVSGGAQKDTLDLRLVGPDEEIDTDRLSTISFSVGRRGRLRYHGHPGTQHGGDGAGLLGAGSGTDEPDGDDSADADADEAPPRTPPVEVPNVNGLSAEEATQELTDAGFEVHTEHRPDETPIGTVVEQWPRAFAVAPQGSSVVLFVGGEQRAT